VVPPFDGTYRYPAVPPVSDVIFVPDEFLSSAPVTPETVTEYVGCHDDV